MILNKFSLEGKSGLVTGGGSGIGKAFVQGLVEAGADVIISGRNLERLSKVAEEPASSGR